MAAVYGGHTPENDTKPINPRVKPNTFGNAADTAENIFFSGTTRKIETTKFVHIWLFLCIAQVAFEQRDPLLPKFGTGWSGWFGQPGHFDKLKKMLSSKREVYLMPLFSLIHNCIITHAEKCHPEYKTVFGDKKKRDKQLNKLIDLLINFQEKSSFPVGFSIDKPFEMFIGFFEENTKVANLIAYMRLNNVPCCEEMSKAFLSQENITDDEKESRRTAMKTAGYVFDTTQSEVREKTYIGMEALRIGLLTSITLLSNKNRKLEDEISRLEQAK